MASAMSALISPSVDAPSRHCHTSAAVGFSGSRASPVRSKANASPAISIVRTPGVATATNEASMGTGTDPLTAPEGYVQPQPTRSRNDVQFAAGAVQLTVDPSDATVPAMQLVVWPEPARNFAVELQLVPPVEAMEKVTASFASQLAGEVMPNAVRTLVSFATVDGVEQLVEVGSHSPVT